MAINSKLGIGPVSKEVVRAVYRKSHYTQTPLMLIASKNQIDYDRGYVNGWTTRSYVDYCHKLEKEYDRSRVYLCRDHCGPGFKTGANESFGSLDDTKATIKADIEAGFDLIHIDLSNASHLCDNGKIDKSKELMTYARSLNPAIQFEYGKEDNAANPKPQWKLLEKEIDSICEVARPVFWVYPTGSLVRGFKQVGTYKLFEMGVLADILRARGIILKEHNADYLSAEEIKLRRPFSGAMNIAPQLGVVQTSFLLHQCLIYGINTEKWKGVVFDSQKWVKWMQGGPGSVAQYVATLVAAHYTFKHPAHLEIVDKLNKYVNVKAETVAEISKVLWHYMENLNG